MQDIWHMWHHTTEEGMDGGWWQEPLASFLFISHLCWQNLSYVVFIRPTQANEVNDSQQSPTTANAGLCRSTTANDSYHKFSSPTAHFWSSCHVFLSPTGHCSLSTPHHAFLNPSTRSWALLLILNPCVLKPTWPLLAPTQLEMCVRLLIHMFLSCLLFLVAFLNPTLCSSSRALTAHSQPAPSRVFKQHPASLLILESWPPITHFQTLPHLLKPLLPVLDTHDTISEVRTHTAGNTCTNLYACFLLIFYLFLLSKRMYNCLYTHFLYLVIYWLILVFLVYYYYLNVK